MAKTKNKPQSLRSKMLVFMLICWLLPVALVVGSMSYYVFRSFNQRVEGEIADGLAVGLQISMDRLGSAAEKLRRTAYDGEVRGAWLQWQNGDFGWISLYSRTTKYLVSQYQSDERFPIVAFWFADDPETMRVGAFVEAAGGSFRQLSQFWEEDFSGAAELAKGLDTYVGFYENSGRLYMVRNLTNRFEVIGTQVIALDTDAFFGGLQQMALGQALCIWLDGNEIVLDGQTPNLADFGLTPEQKTAVQGKMKNGGRYCYDNIEGNGYSLSAIIQIDRSMLVEEFSGYRAILIVMAVLLAPMLILYYRLYENNITDPMRRLMGGAREVERGALGYQVEAEPKSREFRFVIDSFNHMSSQLRNQFEQIYREELSLRDARIKALQSQINPHFLNNTLEIINWEARINGNAKVSQMIEALSTLLDAAMDRDRRPEVRLREEISYINAYFFIADQRFGKRITVTRDIAPETLDLMVPRLILQPVVENALEHGIEPGAYGRISLRTWLSDDDLIIEVENDGALSSDDERRIRRLLSPDYDPSKESAYNLGIANVNQRLRIIYGPPSGLSIKRAEGVGVVARILIAKSNQGK